MVDESTDCACGLPAFSRDMSCETSCSSSIYMLRKNRDFYRTCYPVQIRYLRYCYDIHPGINAYFFAVFCHLNSIQTLCIGFEVDYYQWIFPHRARYRNLICIYFFVWMHYDAVRCYFVGMGILTVVRTPHLEYFNAADSHP